MIIFIEYIIIIRLLHGGLGLHSQVTLGKSAYIASWLTVGPAIATRFPHLKATVANFIEGRAPDGTCSALVHEIVDGLSQQRAHVSETLHLSQVLDDRIIDKNDADPPPRVEGRVEHLQQTFAAEEGRCVAHTLHNKVEALDSGTHLLTKAWHKGLCGFARASYLHAPPSRGVKPLTNVEFEFAIRRHFRIPIRAHIFNASAAAAILWIPTGIMWTHADTLSRCAPCGTTMSTLRV